MDPRTAVRRLLTNGKRVPPPLEKSILGLGAEAVPHLLELVADRSLYDRGFAPLHAMRYLAMLRAPDALEPLFAVLAWAGVESPAFSQALYAIVAFHEAALEPTLARYAAATDDDEKTTYCEILSDLKIQDERIYDALIATYDLDRPLGASHLQAYGDARALPMLVTRLDATTDLLEILTIDDAVRALGGELGRRQAAKVKIAHQEYARLQSERSRRR